MQKRRTFLLLNFAKENAFQQKLLWFFASKIRIGWLCGNENSAELALSRVNVLNLELGTTLEHVKNFVVFVKHFIIAVNARLRTRKCHSHVVTGRHTASLRIEK